MTKEEVNTLDDALRFDVERCTETLKDTWNEVKRVHTDRTPAQQVIVLHRALMKSYTEHPEFLFPLINAVLGKFLVPELTAEEQFSVRMYNVRRKEDGQEGNH